MKSLTYRTLRAALPVCVVLPVLNLSAQEVAVPAPAAQTDAAATLADAWIEAAIPSTDDPDQRFAMLLDVATRYADSPIAELLIDEADDDLGSLVSLDRAIESLQRFLATGPHGLPRQEATGALENLLRRVGRDQEADTLGTRDAFATRFLVIGPFGDSGEFWAGKPFQPELSFPAPGTRLEGRYGPVEVRELDREPWQSGVSLGGGRHRDGCFYALHQVRSETAVAGWIELHTGASYELFVNGERIERLDRPVTPSPLRRFIPVVLRPGANHVLIKTTEARNDGVRLRYVDARGEPLALEEIDANEPQPLAAVEAADLPPAPPTFVDGLEALARNARRNADGPDHMRTATASILADMIYGAEDRGHDQLWAIRDERPEDPRLALALAECFRRADDLPNQISEATSRSLVDFAVEKLPAEHFDAAMQRVALLESDDKLEDAIRLLEERVTAGWAGPATFERLEGLLGKLRYNSRLTQIRQLWLEQRPTDQRPLSQAVSRLVESGRAADAMARLEAALLLTPGDSSMLRFGVSLASAIGDKDRALQMFDHMYRRNPDGIGAQMDRAELLAALGDDAQAVALWNATIDHEDITASQLHSIGIQLGRHDDDAGSRRAFELCLEMEPSRFEVRRLLSRLDGNSNNPSLDAFRVSEAEVDELIAAFEVSDREDGSSSTLLLDRMVCVIQSDGSYIQEVHQVRRINDLAGVQEHEQADDAAYANELVRLRTIGLDGQSYVPKRVDRTFAMPRLEPGAFVEELYRNHHEAAGADPWNGPSFWFQSADEPFLWSELVMVVPPGAPATVRTRNFENPPEVVELEGGWTAMTFTYRDQERLPREPRMPDAGELVPIVAYGEDRSSDVIVRIMALVTRRQVRVTAPIAEATEQLLSQAGEGDMARLQAIHDFVHAEIPSGRGPQDATSILLTRQGPRYFLFVAMLEAAGIPYRHAICAAANEDLDQTPPPMFGGDADYQIQAVRVEPRDGEPLWIFNDAPRYAPMGFAPAARVGAAALLLTGDSYDLVRIPNQISSLPGASVHGELVVQSDGTAKVKAELQLGDSDSLAAADQMREIDANRRDMVGRQLASQLFAGWTVESANLPSFAPGDSFRAEIAAARRGAAQQVDGHLSLPMPLPKSQMLRRLGAPTPRTMPMLVAGQTLEEWDLLVSPGEGLQLAELPEDLRVRHPLFDYSLVFRPEEGSVRIRRTLRIRPGRVEAGAFDEWLQLLQSIDQAEAVRLGFALS